MTVKRWVAVCAALFLSAILASSGFAADYRLLQLNGNLVKWGKPTLGQGAVITWALLDKASRFPDAIVSAAISSSRAGAKTAQRGTASR